MFELASFGFFVVVPTIAISRGSILLGILGSEQYGIIGHGSSPMLSRIGDGFRNVLFSHIAHFLLSEPSATMRYIYESRSGIYFWEACCARGA